jgi:60S ribosome subunit biogenesis protein NIP7
VVLEKLMKFVGKGVVNIVERDDEVYSFRLHKNRVFYVREKLMKRASNVRFSSR